MRPRTCTRGRNREVTSDAAAAVTAVKQSECDLLVTNAFVITMDPERRMYPRGAVAITGGRIVDVGPADRLAPAFRTDRTIDAGGAPVHPGYVEGHVHLLHTARGAFPDSLPYADALALYAKWWDSLTDEEDYRG